MSTSLQPNSTTRHITHQWVIDNISHKLVGTFTKEYPCFISSTTSSALAPHFRLRIYPKGVTSDFKEYLSVGLTPVGLIDEQQQKLVVRCQFSLIDCEGQKCNTKEWSYCFSATKSCSVFGQFITKSNLINPTNGFVRNDKLTLDCQITILGEPSSVGYFDSFVNDLKYISKSNTNLMMEMYHDLALQHKVNEFPDWVQLDSKFDAPFEETMTHHAKSDLTFDSTTLNSKSRPAGPYSMDFSELMSLSCKKTLLDLKFTIDGDKYCDVVLLVEGKQFRSAKFFLAAQSPVFEAMFSHDMKVKNEGQVTLSDVTAEVFEQFLNYLCTGKVSSSMKIKELYEISDRYIIHSIELLKQQCENILCNQIITSETVLELLQFSERFSLNRLKQLCGPFIIDHCGEVVECDSWKDSTSKIEPTLLLELFRDMAQKYQRREFVDRVLLDLPAREPLEESMTQHAKFTLNFKIPSTKWGVLNIVCADARPSLKFKVTRHLNVVSIFYYSSSKIFVKFSATFIKNSFKQINYFSSKFPSKTNSIYTRILRYNNYDNSYDDSSICGMDISLEITIFKKSSSKLGFPELKSLSRSSTLMIMKSMVDSGKHSDVTLLVEGKQFRVHQTILAARSPVFEAMFCNVSKVDCKVSLSDVSAEVFEIFLHYLYSGKVSSQVTLEAANELFKISQNHSTARLSQICRKIVTNLYLSATEEDCLRIASKIEPTLLLELFRDMAQKYQRREFVDRVLLDMPAPEPFEESMTQRAKFTLNFEIPSAKWGELNIVCADARPSLKFRVIRRPYEVRIFYLSTSKILVKFSATFIKNSFKRINHFSSKFPSETNSIDTDILIDGTYSSINGMDISLEITIYKKLSSKLGFPELKSLSRRSTLMIMKSMVDSGKRSDVTLLVEGKQFRVHQAILAARSPVFEAMFGHVSKADCQVSLSDVSAEVFEIFLHYLYSGKVSSQVSLEAANELFKISQNHSTARLSKICRKIVTDHYLSDTEKNCLRIASKIEPTLLVKVYRDMARIYEDNEFPECVPLNLSTYSPLEETVTHNVPLYSFDYEESIWNYETIWKSGFSVGESPKLKFMFKWDFDSIHIHKLYISYLSADTLPNIVVNLSVTCMMYSIRLDKDICFLHEHCSGVLTADSNSMRIGYTSSQELYNISGTSNIEFKLKMAIYKLSCRKLDFPGLQSLSRKQLLSDSKSMLDDIKHCDVGLLVEGKQFRAHKAILVARSIVFEAMFSHDMKEKFESQVSITDVTAQMFEHFLNYLYSGKLFTKVNWQIMELFEIADKYIVELLKVQCENILCLQIITKDAIEILQFSERYSLGRLKQICLNFISDHCFDVLADDSWKIATKIEPFLLMEMYGALALKYQHNEFPNYIPLNLPCDLIPEEALTHQTKSNLTFESTSWKFGQVKESFRKLDSSQLKSLSREQTLLGLKSMLEGGKHCNVTLLVESKQFRAHKSILVARSIVFEAMFINPDMNEKFENQFSLSDVTVEVFGLFLNYLYTGQIPTQIALETVIELFHFSGHHSTVELAKMCIKFVVDHCLEAIDKDYLKIASKFTPKLMMGIFDNLAQQYRFQEFPEYVPLNLPFHRSFDETVTHHAKSYSTIESTNSVNRGNVKESFRKFQEFSELKSISREQLLLDLKSMLNGGKHCDVVLLVEGKHFRAHKSILAAQSIVFEAMFRFNWKENLKNFVEIHDANVEVFEQFIIYLYTGKVDCPIMAKHAMDVFVLADMYHDSTLAQMCLRVFVQSLTPESVYEQFELADRLYLIEFKQVCTDYMNKMN